MRRLISLAAVIIWPLLTAGMCTTEPTPTITQACLPLTPYTPAEQQALADAIAPLPADSPIVLGVTDLGRLRAADRACLTSTEGTTQ